MRIFSKLALAITGVLVGSTWARPIGPIVAQPGTARDIVLTSENTVNGTYNAVAHSSKGILKTAGTNQLPLSLVNNYSGGSLNIYVTGLDPNNKLVMLQPDGSWYYPASTNQTTPVAISANVAIPLSGEGSTTKISLPSYISSGRVWFSEGTLQFYTVSIGSTLSLVEPSGVNPDDPSADINWGFVELTNTEEGGLYANISYVDFVGLVLGMELLAGDGSTQTAQGLQADAVSQICNDLKTQASSDGQPWDQLCVTNSSGNPLRILAPTDYMGSNATAFSDYWTDYVDQVWTQYTSTPLTIRTQASAGDVNCTVSGDTLTCDGDNRGYAKPAASDIFGCNSGPFAIESDDNDVHKAIVPRLCAAFDRSTLLLDGGNVQPSLNSTSYYTVSPTNYYSKIVHSYEVDGKGYAFSYDDVNPDGDTNQSGVVSDANPQLLTVTIGGPTS